MDEQALIREICVPASGQRDDVVVASGDDAACVHVPDGYELVVGVDTLVSGVHFPENTLPEDIGYKAVSVNLSDLAAMGATPAWLTCSLTLPENDPQWMQGCMRGMSELIEAHELALIGGDLSRGPLSITVQAMGLVPAGRAIRRSGAQPGDRVVVMGELGLAGLGLQQALGQVALSEADAERVLAAFNRPPPPVKAGLLMAEFATAMTDVSDGLWVDLQDIVHASGVGVEICADRLPVGGVVLENMANNAALELALSAGEDYVLLATLPAAKMPTWEQACQQQGLLGVEIGEVTANLDMHLLDQAGNQLAPPVGGFRHF